MAHDSLAAIVYADQLRFLRYGEPLWQPEPMDDEVAIGDVGFVIDGQFSRLFNAVDGSYSGRGGLPEGFTKLEYDPEKCEARNTKYMEPRKPHSSRSLEHVRVEAGAGACVVKLLFGTRSLTLHGRKGLAAGYRFKCKENKGAVAISGDWGGSCFVSRTRPIREYVRQYHRSWCELAYSLGYDLRPEQIIFVSGWLKTSQWEIAAILSEGYSHGFTLSAGVGQSLAQAQFDLEVSKAVQVSAIHRSGPVDVAERRQNQCLFLRCYKMQYRFSPLKFLGMTIVAGAGAHHFDSHRDSEGSTSGAESVVTFVPCLSHATCSVAAHDRDDPSGDDGDSSYAGEELPYGLTVSTRLYRRPSWTSF